MQELLARFVTAFKRGIDGELAAMRASAEAFAIPLSHGEELGALRYAFQLASPTDRLAPSTPFMLRTSRGEQRVVIERFAESQVTLVAPQAIDVATSPLALVVAPWFLYDRLLRTSSRTCSRKASGSCSPPRRTPRSIRSSRSSRRAPGSRPPSPPARWSASYFEAAAPDGIVAALLRATRRA